MRLFISRLNLCVYTSALRKLNTAHAKSIPRKPRIFYACNRIFLHENRAIIAQRFSYFSSKNCTKFRCVDALMRKSYFAQIIKKILVFAHIVIPAISVFRAISLNFEKQFLEMKESKIKPIRAPSLLRPALTPTFLNSHF